MRFKDLENIIENANLIQHARDLEVRNLLIDSRKIVIDIHSLFFAIKGIHHDGHDYIEDLYLKGIRQFIVEDANKLNPDRLKEANILQVDNSINALQKVATYHRNMFYMPVVGITGSNGKTIVKEWLSQVLSERFKVVRSPKSYNSQVGVPLSVWQINSNYELGIFEAGISQPEEMQKLERVIQPTIGIFTNIGTAHDQGFASREEKVNEKSKLFKNCRTIIYCKDHEEVHYELMASSAPETELFSWSRHPNASVYVENIEINDHSSAIHIIYNDRKIHFTVPFADQASLENCLHCITFLLHEQFGEAYIQRQLNQLHRLEMRLELKQGVNECYIIDDSYNNDFAGFQIALDFLCQQKQRDKKTVILSDMLQSGLDKDDLYEKVAFLLKEKGIDRFIGIGKELAHYKELFDIPDTKFLESTALFFEQSDQIIFDREIVLVKGARIFAFEKIVEQLQQKIHGTVLEINLDALTGNLNFYRSKLNISTKMMVMVKAFAYGSGLYEIANLLQFHRIDYLGVAYADEGVALRRNGIDLPVMVMNPSPDSFTKIIDYQLEPEIYNLRILKSLINFLDKRDKKVKIHIKLDTGMHRLGFEEKHLTDLINLIKDNENIVIASIFSHLAGADEEVHNEFSKQQINQFDRMYQYITSSLGIEALKHILNSAGIIRFPEYQFDMVRLGIGLYGVEATNTFQKELQAISTLKTRISQIKEIKEGETVGYSRKGEISKTSRIATIAIGYADGFSRAFSNGKGYVMIKSKIAPVIGNVCMDMTMVDVTGIDAEEGDEVIVFGRDLPINKLADRINTIPYEILTNVSERVKRVFYTE